MTPIKNQVFIGGCGRSGTTFLGSILGTNPSCLVVPETIFKTTIMTDPHTNKQDIYALFEKIKKSKQFRYWRVDPSSIDPKSIESYAELLLNIIHLYNQKANKQKYDTWIDHTPNNIMHTKLLLDLFPEAKFIHIVRDGRAVANSVMPLDWGPNTIHSSSQTWINRLSFGLAAESKLGPEKIIRIRYEDLVLNMEVTLNKICKFLGIEYSQEMLEANGFIKTKYTEMQHRLVGKQADISRVNQWKKELTPRQIEIYESNTCDLLHNLGYELIYGEKAKGSSTLAIFIVHLYDIILRYFVKIPRKKLREFKHSRL